MTNVSARLNEKFPFANVDEGSLRGCFLQTRPRRLNKIARARARVNQRAGYTARFSKSGQGGEESRPGGRGGQVVNKA